jgi:hypothetical protein
MSVKTAGGNKQTKKNDKPQKDTTKNPKNGGNKKKAVVWTDDRVARLIKWHEKLQGKDRMYDRIAEKMKTSRHAVYKKLGRLGRIDAKWATKFISK